MVDTKKEQERDELHRAIWAIADELRGAVDGWDFKNYVLGTMFYRYISENLRKKESHKQLTDTEKARLAEVRDAMKQNRKFPEKVIKYLWDDAFKFNREIMFETTEYQSLEQVIRAFMYAEKLDRFKMFKENVRSAFTNPED